MTQRTVASSLVPRLAVHEWILFALLAGVLTSTNIYTTLLIGWGDTGSIVAVLAAVATLALFRRRSGIYQINLGQTMASAGGSIGFAAACYASLYIVDPQWSPNPFALMALFASAGILGALVGTAVRKQMVQYFFPSGTACAVIQRAVTGASTDGDNRPVWLLKVWGIVAMLVALPTKISLGRFGKPTPAGESDWPALLPTIQIPLGLKNLPVLPISSDPLMYGIGLVVGPRIGLGMIIGALLPLLWIEPMLATGDGSPHPFGSLGDWKRWIAIAVLTLPTFATIVFAYLYRVSVPTPPGFTPGATTYTPPAARRTLYATLAILGLGLAAMSGQIVFGLPWVATIATVALAFPLSIVNGRVTGDTDINPVRLVAIVLISAFFWLVAKDAAVLLGMAVVGATVASVAVDMMTDMRTGHLLDQDSGHQSFVQVVGVCVGAVVAVPVLSLLVAKFGIGEGTVLSAPGSQVWAAMAKAMAGGVSFTDELVTAIAATSAVGVLYAWLTIWPRSARFMPSLFGIGIGLLLTLDIAMAMFLGGAIKGIATYLYTKDRAGEERDAARRRAGDDTMVVGASIFAAAAVLSIGLVLLDTGFDFLGWRPWHLAH